MGENPLRIDLHVHSRYSKRPSQWILQKIGCPESFTDPALIYETARKRGMDLVTITDHNTIDGALEIAHLPGTFISEEITTYFPDDGCKLHVLAWDITEAQHEDFQKLRENVFDLVPYLHEQGITHALAHPLFAVNDRLTLEHFEQALLLFDVLEANGSRDARQNDSLRAVVKALGPRQMERLAEIHGIEPVSERPWEKIIVGGSDDHSSINIARMHTRFRGEATTAGLLEAISEGRCEPAGEAATPRTMAHNLYGIAYQFYVRRSNLSEAARQHVVMRFAENSLNPAHDSEPNGIIHRFRRFVGRGKAALHSFSSNNESMRDALLKSASDIITADVDLTRVANGRGGEPRLLENELARFISGSANRVLRNFADKVLDSAMGGNFFDIFHTIGSAGSLYVLLAPYFVGYDLFSRERGFCNRALKRFGVQNAGKRPLRIAHFTDTFDEINGVAKTIKNQLDLVSRHGKQMTVVSCGADGSRRGLANFDPVGEFAIPEYPELTLRYPPVLEMLEYCFDREFDCILAATPGPVGLAGLAVSKILKIPFHGTYHTAFPQYVRAFTEDTALEDGCWKFMTWFYNQMQVIYAPSEATRQELIDRGIDPGKITTYPRGVDVERFHPAKRNGFFTKFNMQSDTKLIYVGRVSREKGLDTLAEAYRRLWRMRPGVSLVVVGDGPYLEEMKRVLRGTPAVFTGPLHGEDLSAAYASSDVFVFPSATDTFGNVVLEAQASGLPCIVTDQGGPCENIDPDETGLVIPAADPDALIRAALHLIDAPERLNYMRRKARARMEHRTFDQTFLETWELFGARIRDAA